MSYEDMARDAGYTGDEARQYAEQLEYEDQQRAYEAHMQQQLAAEWAAKNIAPFAPLMGYADGWWVDDEGRRHEPLYQHSGRTGWHHHHTEAGAIAHNSEAVGEVVDDDGTVIVYSKHWADHDTFDLPDEPCPVVWQIILPHPAPDST